MILFGFVRFCSEEEFDGFISQNLCVYFLCICLTNLVLVWLGLVYKLREKRGVWVWLGLVYTQGEKRGTIEKIEG